MQHYFECSRSKQLATALKRSPRPTGDRQILLYSLVHIVNNKRIDFVVPVLTGGIIVERFNDLDICH